MHLQKAKQVTQLHPENPPLKINPEKSVLLQVLGLLFLSSDKNPTIGSLVTLPGQSRQASLFYFTFPTFAKRFWTQ